jgi:hypothetical protein
MKTMLVDLYTLDRELDSIILGGFPILFPDTQYKIDNSEPGIKSFCFFDLDYDVLKKFLMPHKARHEYEIRSKEGEILEVNLVNKLECSLFREN